LKTYLLPINVDLEKLPKKPSLRAKYLAPLSYLARNSEGKPKGFYRNVFSQVFKEVMGTSYNKILDELEKLGYLDINRRCKPSKRDASGKVIERGFTRSYRLTCNKFAEHREEFTPKPCIVDFTDGKNPVSRAIRRNSKKLKIDFKLVDKRNPYLNEDLALEKERLKVGSTKQGYGGRYYHPYLSMDKTLRPYVRTKAGKKLIDYDAQASYFFFLIAYFEDSAEKASYLADYHADIYKLINPHDREAGKQSAREFLCSKGHFQRFKASPNRASEFFKARYPKAFAKIVSIDGRDVARHLATMESSIFCEFGMRAAQKARLFYLPMHDGFVTDTEKGAAKLKDLIESECTRRFGACPLIKEVAPKTAGLAVNQPIAN
jgi:hypothetical protein